MKKYPEGSPQEEMSESPSQEMAEQPSEHELDMHHDTLMKAESIKANGPLMKHLVPHMQKKMGHMKKLVPESSEGPIRSIDGLKKASKAKMSKEPTGSY